MLKNSNFGEEFKVMLQILIKLLEINQTKNIWNKLKISKIIWKFASLSDMFIIMPDDY